jgi:hydroxypyruvate reductase
MNLREDLHKIQTAALAAVDAGNAVRRYMRCRGETLNVRESSWDLSEARQIQLIGFGKAVVPMAEAAVEVLGSRIARGAIITKYDHATGYALPEKIAVIEAGHPVPDAAGQRGAEKIVSLLANADARDFVLVLISGGGSALLPLPVEGVSLSDLQMLTNLLLRSGATIDELNAVRKHLSRLKGGQLARLASPATVITLVLSDVVGDPLDVIASGPTVPDTSTYADAWAVLERYDVLSQVPKAVRAHLRQGLDGKNPETPKPGDPCFEDVCNTIVGSNRQAAQAAVTRAKALGYRALLLTTFVEGEAREVAKIAAALVKGVRRYGDPVQPPACLVWGGETTVTVTGEGKGGRNQELALAAALALEDVERFCIMALATDGTDGPTDAGGATVDGSTVKRARSLGFDAIEALANNDAYPLLAAVDDLVMTGPTGTNVNDLLVVLIDRI